MVNYELMVNSMELKPSSHEAREIAVESETHPITVAKFVNGGEVRPLTAQRIERALVARGWTRDGAAWERGATS